MQIADDFFYPMSALSRWRRDESRTPRRQSFTVHFLDDRSFELGTKSSYLPSPYRIGEAPVSHHPPVEAPQSELEVRGLQVFDLLVAAVASVLIVVLAGGVVAVVLLLVAALVVLPVLVEVALLLVVGHCLSLLMERDERAAIAEFPAAAISTTTRRMGAVLGRPAPITAASDWSLTRTCAAPAVEAA
jgi:hypothetical protein